MAYNTGKVEVQIDATHKGLEKGFRDASRALERYSAKLDTLAGKLDRVGKQMMLKITAPLAAMGAMSVKTAAEFEALGNNLNMAFRESADEARAWAYSLGDSIGRSRMQMERFMGSTQAMLAPMMENREAAGIMTKALTQLSLDLAAYYDVADDTALNALQSGLIGSTLPMRQFGVVITESTLALEAQRIGLNKTVAQMTEAEKVALRYLQIIRQTQDAHGDALIGADGLADQIKALQADFENLRVEIGVHLMPYALGLVAFARELTSRLADLNPETIETIINFATWAAGIGLAAYAMGKLIRTVALLGKSISILFRFIAANPWVAIATLAAAWAMTFEQVQDSLDSFGRSIGLGGVIDTVGGVVDAFGDILSVLDGMEFTPGELDATEYIAHMEEASEAIREMLKDGTFGGMVAGAEDAIAAIERQLSDAASRAMGRRAADLMMETLLSGGTGVSWSPFDVSPLRGLWSGASPLDKASTKLEMHTSLARQHIEALSELMDTADIFATSTDPKIRAMQGALATILEHIQATRRELYDIDIDRIGREFDSAMSGGADAAKRMAQAIGEPFDVLDWRIGEARRLIEERIEANVAINLEWDEGLDEFIARLQRLLRQQADEAREAAIHRIMFDTKMMPSLVDPRAFADAGRVMIERQIDYLQQVIREKTRDMDISDLFAPSFGIADGTPLIDPRAWAEFAKDAGISGDVADLKEAMATLERITLDERLQGIKDELATMLPGGARYAVEEFLGSIGDGFDSTEYQMRAVEQALWGHVDALLEAGKSWHEIRAAVEGYVYEYDELADRHRRERQAARLGDIRGNLDRTLDSERWIQSAFARAAGQEFDAVQFEADALQQAMNQIAAEMLADGATVDDILADTQDLQDRLSRAMSIIASRGEMPWIEAQFAQAGDMLAQFGMGIFNALTPVGILARVLEALAGPMERMLAPISIVAEVIAVALEPAFRALFPVLKMFGIIVITIVQGIATVWNAIVGTIGGIFRALSEVSIFGWRPLAFLEGTADFFDGLKMDTDEMSDAMKRLRDLTYDQADAAQATSEALRNVPDGFKVALRRFQVAQPTAMPAGGAYGTYNTMSMATPETVIPLSGNTAAGMQVHVHGDVYGWDDFKGKVAQANGENEFSNDLALYGR